MTDYNEQPKVKNMWEMTMTTGRDTKYNNKIDNSHRERVLHEVYKEYQHLSGRERIEDYGSHAGRKI